MAKQQQNVQISFKLFLELIQYHCISDDPDYELQQSIAKSLEKKLDDIVTREMYTRSKTAATPEEREKARQEYLDKRGIHKDFRW